MNMTLLIYALIFLNITSQIIIFKIKKIIQVIIKLKTKQNKTNLYPKNLIALYVLK